MRNPWSLYDELIAGVPRGILVRDFCIGTHWSYVEAECGCGVAYTATGGSRVKTGAAIQGCELADVAALSKSWRFEDASIGIAALNAWYAQRGKLEALGATFGAEMAPEGARGGKTSAFSRMRPEIEARGNAKVVIVGHFPNSESFDEISELTILERVCRDEWDTPDPACEYVLPGADYVFVTGVTLINKTAPRLIELAKGAKTIFVGPSVVPAQALMARGVDILSGSCVIDVEKAKYAVKRGGGKWFGEALDMYEI